MVCVAYRELLEWKLQGWWFSGKRYTTKIKERTLGLLVLWWDAVISAPSSSWLLLYLDTGNRNTRWQLCSEVAAIQATLTIPFCWGPDGPHLCSASSCFSSVTQVPRASIWITGCLSVAFRVLRVSRLMGYASHWRVEREAPDSCPDCFLSVT